MRFPLRFLSGQEQAAMTFVLADYITHNPKYRDDPAISSLLKKFKVGHLETGIEVGVKEKVGAVLADLDAGISTDRIAKLHDLPISAVEEVRSLHERNKNRR